MIESEYYSKVIETDFNKPLLMAENIMKPLIILLNVRFVKKHMKKLKKKIKDDDHITGECMHQECDLILA